MNELIELALAASRLKYPSFPEQYRAKPKYTDKTANGLTKCIIDYLNFKGHQAERIASSGRVIDNRQTYTNVLGQVVTIGSSKYIPGTSTRGTADISSTIKVNLSGRYVGISAKWEVKMKDSQSKDQKKYEENVQRAAGHYYIVHSFDEFLFFYNKMIQDYEQG